MKYRTGQRGWVCRSKTLSLKPEYETNVRVYLPKVNLSFFLNIANNYPKSNNAEKIYWYFVKNKFYDTLKG